MLAGPTATLRVMRKALSHSLGALTAALTADIDRTDDDRAFFAAERAKLEPLAAQLKGTYIALDIFDLGPREELQAQVEIGDDVLDRGVRDANARTKIGVKGKPGLDATHAFGHRVDDLTGAPLAHEPAQVLKAVARMNDLPAFDERTTLQNDLTRRCEQQESLLVARNAGNNERLKLVSEGVRCVVESALALASLKGALDSRFPRQRGYVAAFFFNTKKRRTRKKNEDGNDPDT